MKTMSDFRRYYTNYGGISSLLASKYFAITVSITLFLYLERIRDYSSLSHLSLYINPFLLIFTVISFIGFIISLCDKEFKNIIVYNGYKECSPLETITASFVHYMIIHFITITNSLLFIVLNENFDYNLHISYHMFSMFIFIYSIMLTFATLMSIIHIVKWYTDCKNN